MSDQNPFVHLHVHTEFSLLDGLSRIKKLVKRAKELDMSAMAITDHGTMFGVMNFFDAATDAEIKPIIGLETYLAPRGMTDRDPQIDRSPFHLLLLAKDMTGYKNLMKISSAGQLEGYYYRPRIDWDFLVAHSEGLIATTGCLAAKIPSLIEDGKDDQAREWIGKFVDLFGEDHFYLELQEHDIDIQRDLNRWIIDYNKTNHTNVGLLATTDVHYVNRTDYDIHDTQLCIQTSSLKDEKNRLRFSDNSYYVYSPQEMWDIYREVPEALTNSVKIAEMTDIDLRKKGYHLPVFPVPEGYEADTYLRYLCEKGMDWRFGERKTDPVLVDRLNRELGIIHDMGFDTYFLIVWDLCEFARHSDIWWNVRGSGAGSLAAYCLGITNIDPIQNSLLFERFLNPGRVSMPDIDLDYPDNQRGDMIAYAARKYGEDKVAAIITFGTLGPKNAVRDVGRAFGVPLSEINRAAGLIPQEAKPKPLMDYVNNIPDLKKLYDENADIKRIFDAAKELQGISRNTSQHAAGVIISDRPLVEYTPLHRITGKDPSGGALKAITQFPMETAESIGLLKVDFLGLSTLTIFRKASELIERYHGIKYTMDTTPYRHDDPHLTDTQRKMLDEAFEMLGRGETVGVFQVESSGMQQMLRDMKPKVFENIIAGVSLYRPGPMEFIPQYNRRLQNKEVAKPLHPKLNEILGETYQIIVYQEQIMQIASDLFGYELGEADLMRRAVSKKKEKDLKKHRDIFLERGPANGVDADTAGKIFDDIEFFANYGFNKSHATDYAVITVQTAYLKCHYPAEYMTALLSVQRDDSTKVATFLEECHRLKIPILPPDINYSLTDFDIQPDPASGRRGIRFGLAAIKNAGEAALAHIVHAQKTGGAFQSVSDFCKRVDLREVGKRALESLIKVGAMRAIGDRGQLLHGLDRMMSFSTTYQKDKAIGQLNMFGDDGGGLVDDSIDNLPPSPIVYSEREQLLWEKELLGLYVSGRPVDKYREALSKTRTRDIADLKLNTVSIENVGVAGEIVNLRKIYTNKTGEAMVVIQLEDWHDSASSIEVVVFPRTYNDVLRMVETEDLVFDVGEVVQIMGKYDMSRGDPQIIAERVTQSFEIMEAIDERDLLNYDDHAPSWVDDEAPYPDDLDEWSNPNLVPDSGFPVNSNGHSNGHGDNHYDTIPEWAKDNAPEQVEVPVIHEPPFEAAPIDDTSDDDSADDDIYDEETGEVIQPETIAPPEKPYAVAPASAGAVGHITPSIEPTFAPEPTRSEDVPDPNRMEQERKDPYHVDVFLRRTGQDDVDRRNLLRLHGLLISYYGHDTFTIYVEGSGRLDFPNHTTSISEKMLNEILSVVRKKDDIRYYKKNG